MGYRFDKKEPPKPNDLLPRFEIDNGAITTLAFPCYYVINHASDKHDHWGWPTPDRIDAICQDVDGETVIPIDLKDEGYNSFRIVFDNSDIDITSEVSVDDDEPYTIYLWLQALYSDFTEGDPKEERFTIFAATTDTEPERLDKVIRGVIVVNPGAITTGSIQI